jgi:hypothetical protein
MLYVDTSVPLASLRAWTHAAHHRYVTAAVGHRSARLRRGERPLSELESALEVLRSLRVLIDAAAPPSPRIELAPTFRQQLRAALATQYVGRVRPAAHRAHSRRTRACVPGPRRCPPPW